MLNIIKNIAHQLSNINSKDNKLNWTEEEAIQLAHQLQEAWLGEYNMPVPKAVLERYLEMRMLELPKNEWELWSKWEASKAMNFYYQYLRHRANGYLHHITNMKEFFQYLKAPGCTPIAEEVECWYRLLTM